jgi:hypothetical protein
MGYTRHQSYPTPVYTAYYANTTHDNYSTKVTLRPPSNQWDCGARVTARKQCRRAERHFTTSYYAGR